MAEIWSIFITRVTYKYSNWIFRLENFTDQLEAIRGSVEKNYMLIVTR